MPFTDGDHELVGLLREAPPLLKNVAELAARYGHVIKDDRRRGSGAAERVNAQIQRLSEPFRLGVIGGMKAGKSSVINSFLEEEVCPAGEVRCTAARVVISRGEARRAIVRWHDGRADSVIPIAGTDWEPVRPYIDRNSPDCRESDLPHIREIRLELPHPFLQNLEIVDTPGLASPDPAERALTESIMPDMDAVIWVFNADRIGDRMDLDYLHFLRRYSKHVLAVLNAVDIYMNDGLFDRQRHAANRQFLTSEYHGLFSGSIFDYSADKVLETKGDAPDASIPGWGYASLITYLQQFMANDADLRRMKAQDVRNGVVAIVRELLDQTKEATAPVRQQLAKTESDQSAQARHLAEVIEPRRVAARKELERIADLKATEFFQALERSFTSFTEAKMNLWDGARVTLSKWRNEESTTKELNEEFLRDYWDPGIPEAILDEAREKAETLLKQEWQEAAVAFQHAIPAVKLPMEVLSGDLARNVFDTAVKTVVWAALTALIFSPQTGALVDAASVLFGMKFDPVTASRENAPAAARRAVRLLENKKIPFRVELKKGFHKWNDALYTQVREQILKSIGEGEGRSRRLREVLDGYDQVLGFLADFAARAAASEV